MNVVRIEDGLWRWTAPHPDWKPGAEWEREVGCVYWEAPDTIVLVDPLAPPPGADLERFLEALDRDIERVGHPVVVLTTCTWHARSAAELSARYSGHVINPASAANAELPSGVEAINVPVADEIVFWLEGARTLVPGDALLGDGAGGVRMCPSSWLDSGGSIDSLRAELAPALELGVERILVSHGEPVLGDGNTALVRALA